MAIGSKESMARAWDRTTEKTRLREESRCYNTWVPDSPAFVSYDEYGRLMSSAAEERMFKRKAREAAALVKKRELDAERLDMKIKAASEGW